MGLKFGFVEGEDESLEDVLRGEVEEEFDGLESDFGIVLVFG